MNLDEIAAKFGTDKHEHGYCPFYEQHLGDFGLYRDVTLLEIGVHQGASIRMWHAWRPWWKVKGVDIALLPEGNIRDLTNVDVWEADGTDPLFAELLDPVDVVIDDGSHQASDIVTSLTQLWPKVTASGWYVIEDLGAQFWEKWGGSPVGSPAIDLLLQAMKNVLLSDSEVSEMHVYGEIVFLRKAAA